MIIEHWSFMDSLYMVVITLATVGYREIHPLSPLGMVFTMLLIVFGIVTLYYVVRALGEHVLEGRFDANYKAKKMRNEIQNLKNHYIVCGFGRVGEKVAMELNKDGVSFVVIENDPAAINSCNDKGFLCSIGDATSEEALLAAGLMNAKGLITTLGKDSDNMLTVITARTLRSDLFIIARANGDSATDKLLRVGANRAVSPYQISAFRMATFALRPNIADFVDNILDLDKSEIQISDMTVGSHSPLSSQPLERYLANRKSGVSVLVIHRGDGRVIINPLGNTEIEAGDRLIVMGTRQNLTVAEKLFNR
jgi:voltage-gated potassium channel